MDTNNNVIDVPNAPNLYSGENALTPVTWTKNGDGVKEMQFNTGYGSWYSWFNDFSKVVYARSPFILRGG